MAIEEQNRENLLRDATAFTQRVLWQGAQTEVFVGIRSDGRWSLYVNQDVVLQFSGENQLRRIFIAPRKYASIAGELYEIVRVSRGGKVQLQQVYLDLAMREKLLRQCHDELRAVLDLVSGPKIALIGTWPENQSELPKRMIQIMYEASQTHLRLET